MEAVRAHWTRPWLSWPALVALAPMAYAANPILHVLKITDERAASYGPTAVLVALALLTAAALVLSGRRKIGLVPLDVAVGLLTAAIVVAAVVGLARHNAATPLLGDLFHNLEFCAFYAAARVLLTTER